MYNYTKITKESELTLALIWFMFASYLARN